jgi:hypothetical protein
MAIGGMWTWSYDAKAILRLPVSAGATRLEFLSYRGQLALTTIADFPTAQRSESVLLQTNPARAARWDIICWDNTLGGFIGEDGLIFVPDARGQAVARDWCRLVVPYWMMLALALPVPLWEIYLAIRARRRTMYGQCAACGYACETFGVYAQCPACAARQHVIGATPRTRLT